MKMALVMLLLLTSQASAQSIDRHIRVLAGADGGSIYGSDFIDLNAGIEAPISRRFEGDANIHVAVLEHKIGLGFGSAWGYRLGGIVWVTRNLGINSYFSHSAYNITQAKKSGSDMLTGVTYRTYLGAPVRFSFDYLRQVDNHVEDITYNCKGKPINGTESNYLQGGEFNMQVRMGTLGPSIVRLVFDTQVGRSRNQGNPRCDGTFVGHITCPRTSTIAGGASVGVLFEFPRHRRYENSRF
jgi:hypothetical protein